MILQRLLLIILLSIPSVHLSAQNLSQSETAHYFANRSEGMSAVATELNALKQLIAIVQSLPEERGRYRIAFDRLLIDIDLIRQGVLQTINQPLSSPVLQMQNYPALSSDYLQ